jgi:hypothetical protein
VIAIFCGIFIDYMIRYRKLHSQNRAIARRQHIFFGGLASAIVFILARCAYRVDELSQGYSESTKITNEPLFIGLEGV